MAKRKAAGALAFAGGLALRAAEELEEVVARDHAVRNLRGAHAAGNAGELGLGAGGEREGIDHLLRAQATRMGVTEVNRVILVPLVLHNGELIGARLADGLHQLAQVEAVLHELRRERVEQFRIARRIAGADVVHRIDDAAAEEVAPDAVRHRLGEERILRRDEPVNHRHATVIANRHGLGVADRNLGRDGRVGLEMLHLAAVVLVINDLLGGDHERTAGLGEDDLLADLAFFETNLRKVRAHLVILILRPLLERMVVTLVAVEAHAQEGLRDILGHLARLTEDAEIVHRRVLVAAAFCG